MREKSAHIAALNCEQAPGCRPISHNEITNSVLIKIRGNQPQRLRLSQLAFGAFCGNPSRQQGRLFGSFGRSRRMKRRALARWFSPRIDGKALMDWKDGAWLGNGTNPQNGGRLLQVEGARRIERGP